MASSPYLASGDIQPCRFVRTDGDFSIAEANANEKLFGISQEGTRIAPIPDVSEVLAAKVGEECRVFQDGEVCLLQIGAGQTITADQDLKSDSDGCAVPALTTGTVVQQIGAVALQGGAAGEKILVRVRIDSKLPAVA